ncbi:DUF4845 domain-containing protein [Chitinimonas naiadis]
MQKQRGVSLINMLAWAILLGMGLILGLKLVPVYTEYFGVKGVLKALVRDQAGAPVSDIREAFVKRADIENIHSVTAGDLDIIQDQSGTRISASYQAVVPLVGNASLVFDFHAEERRGGGK